MTVAQQTSAQKTSAQKTGTAAGTGEGLVSIAPPALFVDALWIGWRHEGDAADLVRSLKYGRLTAAVTPIADRMAQVSCGARAALVTWVPCSPSHRRGRGFDPAELLARALARRLRVKSRRLLRRDDDRPQTSRTLQGRLEGPDLSFCGGRLGGSVLLVDDVCTTGSTLRAAAAELRAAGASSVSAAVATAAALTPRQPAALPLR
ncbi:MAG: phosphoribosyltransferase family protein [Acidimicrobiaceae bacterium]|nr:phosphoribosyltransferase family protein [Acidimicrobiaceae bacterium]